MKGIEIMKGIEKIFPDYNETKTLQKGKSKVMCKIFGHVRIIHHAFYTEETKRGKEYYEVYACTRCSDIEAKLVRISTL